VVGLRTLELSLYIFVSDQVFMRYELLLRTDIPVAIFFPTEDSTGLIVQADNSKAFLFVH